MRAVLSSCCNFRTIFVLLASVRDSHDYDDCASVCSLIPGGRGEAARVMISLQNARVVKANRSRGSEPNAWPEAEANYSYAKGKLNHVGCGK